tara:strand:+ start:2166 stop:4496 length:2331 start_codon:yes stop_codon:yes gene_type:complete
MKKPFKLNLSLLRFLKKYYPSTYKFNEMLIQKGIQNSNFIPDHTYRSWPSWISKQLQLNQTPHITDTNYLGLINTKYRNWTYLSSPDSNNAAIVDPSGLIYIKGKPFSIDFWISNSNSLFIPSHKDEITQQYLPDSNSVRTSFSLSQLDIESHVIFSKLPGNYDFAFCNYTITNNTKKNIKFSFYIAIRPFDFEGVTNIRSIQYLQSGIFMVDKQLGIILDQKPDNVICLAHQDGDVSEHFNKLEMIFSASCPLKKVSAFAEYRLVISPNESLSLSFKNPCLTKTFSNMKIPFLSTVSPIDVAKNTYKSFSFNEMLKELSFYNSDLCNHELSFVLPDHTLTCFLKAQFSFLISSIHSNTFKHGYYTELNHSILDHLVFIKMLYIGGYKPALYSNIFSIKYLNQVYAGLKTKTLFFSDCAAWFEHLLYLNSVNIITITQDIYKLLFKIIMVGINQFKLYDKSELTTLAPRHTSHNFQKTSFLSDMLGLYACIESFKLLSKSLSYPSSNKVNIETLNHYSLLLSDSIDRFCDVVSNKICFNDIVPVSSTQYINLELIKTLLLYITYFPKNKERIKTSYSNIQKHLIYNDLVFSMINPSGFSLSHNLDYLKLLITLDPKSVFNIVNTLLSLISPTFTFPDNIHPISRGGSEGEGHNIKHGILLAQYIFDTIVSLNQKTLTLFPAIPSNWLMDHSWNIKNYRLGNGSICLSIKQSPIETVVDITSTKTILFDFIMIHTHYQFKSFIINDTEIAIKSPVIKVPRSETNIRFIKRNDTEKLQ